MLRFIIRRLAQTMVVLFALSVLLFAWLHSLPGGPVSALLGERSTPEKVASVRAALGLDQPIYVQYWKFLSNALQGDFGTSTGVRPGVPAGRIFMERLPATIELGMTALVIAVVLGIPLGYFAARRKGGALDNLAVISSLIGIAVPVFFLAFMLKLLFAVEWGLLPLNGRQDAIDATRVTGFFVLDGLLTGELDASWNALQHLILPALALATIPFAVIFRITRASVLEVLDEDYVRTAESKGLLKRTIRGRHVLRNALIPVVTTIGIQMGALLSGAILTESVFSFPGIGDALYLGFQKQDYPVMQVLIMASAFGFVIINLVVDLLYGVIDPRVRAE